MSNGFYSLIQFSPDFGRQEAFNVGIAVFCPETGFTAVEMAPGFGPNAPRGVEANLELFEATKAAFANRFKSEASRFRGADDMGAFRASGTNPLHLTSPRQIMLRSGAEDVRAAFKSLVDRPVTEPGKERVTKGPRMKTRLRQAFATRMLVPFLERDVEARVPAFGTKLKVPYAYHNGRYNLIEPVDFTMRNEALREERTAWFAVVGSSIFETPDPSKGDRKLVVVAQLPNEPAVATRVSTMLQDYHVECIPFSEAGLDRLAAEIREHAGAPATTSAQS